MVGGLVLSFVHGRAQPQWVPAGVPFFTGEVNNIQGDTVADALYICGESFIDGGLNADYQAVSVYSDGHWDTLGAFNNRPSTIVRWHDTLVAGGGFSAVNGQPFQYIACYVGNQWHPYGDLDGPVYRLKIIDGELYAIGAFEYADGNLCNGIARREGNVWVNIGTMDVGVPPYMQDLILFQGELIATGVIWFTSSSYGDVARFNGTEWVPLGTGILGGFSAGRSLAVYQDELYVSGSIDINAGNAGHGIMRWDGAQFHPVGTGLQGSTNDYSYIVGAVELEVHDGLLWASGTFLHAGNVPTPGIAAWDGTQWCCLPPGPDVVINSIEFFHDTLFASTVGLYGSQVWGAVKFVDDAYFDTCSIAMSLPEPTTCDLQLHYAPATAILHLSTSQPINRTTLDLFDPLGRLVVSFQLHGQREVSVAALAPGTYVARMLRVQDVVGTGRFAKW